MIRWSVGRDKRPVALIALAIGSALVAFAITMVPGRGVDAQRLADTAARRQESVGFPIVTENRAWKDRSEAAAPEIVLPPPATDDEIRAYGALKEAETLLKKRQADQAIRVLDAARPVLREMPEAYLLLGRALEERGDEETARDFYLAAIDRNPYLYDAHWGVATTSEKLGELDAAVGAMRSYLHTETDPAPDRLRVNQARSAIWEWEAQLGRGEWGPTRGVPPDFTAEQIKRDGRGVGVKMQKPETLRPDGTWEFEIKSSEKVQIYPRP